MGAPPPAISADTRWRPLLDEVVEQGAAVSEQQLAERQAAVRPADPAMLMYTSGTTGLPKGALLSHHPRTGHAVLWKLTINRGLDHC